MHLLCRESLLIVLSPCWPKHIHAYVISLMHDQIHVCCEELKISCTCTTQFPYISYMPPSSSEALETLIGSKSLVTFETKRFLAALRLVSASLLAYMYMYIYFLTFEKAKACTCTCTCRAFGAYMYMYMQNEIHIPVQVSLQRKAKVGLHPKSEQARDGPTPYTRWCRNSSGKPARSS